MRLCTFALLCLAVAAFAAKPLATFTCKEWLGVDWPRTLVTYQVTFPKKAAKPDPDMVRLVDADGKEVPVQLSHEVMKDGYLVSAWVSFFTELKKNGSYSYTLLAERSLFYKEPEWVMAKDVALPPWIRFPGCGLDNKLVSVILPDEGETKYNPVCMMDSIDRLDKIYDHGPIWGYHTPHTGDGQVSYFWAADPATAPKITSCTCEITAYGPLIWEGIASYTFDNGGWYRCTVRLLADDPNIYIDEECDLKTIRAARDWRVVFPLTASSGIFKPVAAWWCSNQGRLKGADADFEASAVKAGFAPLPASRDYLGSMTFQPPAEKKRLFELAVWYPYYPNAYYVGFTEKLKVALRQKEDIPFVGVMPMHAGNWRGMAESSNGEIDAYPDGGLAVSWPLTVSPHPNSLLHTGEYDPALPYTQIRRQWALMTGPMQYQQEMLAFRRYNGYITLDDYKDWKLEWPTDPKVTYPREIHDKAFADAWKGKLAQHPMGDKLQSLLYFTDDAARCKTLFTQLSSEYCWSGPRGQTLNCLSLDDPMGWVAGFRHAQMAAWTNTADEALSSRYLTPEQRMQARAWVAAACYALTEPDFNPRGGMMHLGNPNMPMNRFFGLAFAASLIPDHPMAKTWLNVAKQYLRYKLAENTAPGGGWSELLTYYMAAASHCMQTAMVLNAQGMLDDDTAKLAAQAGSFPLDLLSPKDPRFGARCLPAFGHEGYWMIPTQWLPVASFLKTRDPQLAKDMVWAWDQLGRPQEDHHDAGFSPRAIIFADLLNDIPKDYVPARLRSKWIPGFGATMRAHVGDPDETYFGYRQGYMVSHCDANQGDYVLYSKGAPLTSVSLFQYAIYNGSTYQKMYETFGWHNRVRFGAQSNTGGWPGGGPISQVHRFFTSDSVDYLRGMGDYGPQRWTRQVMFLKGKKADGPNYFIFRDSFTPTGADPLEQKWWYFKSDGDTKRITANPAGLVYTSPWGPKLDIHFLQPAAVATESRQATGKGPLYNRAAMLWQQAGNKIDNGQVEETITITAAGPIPAGQDILVALYPETKDEQAPKYERLAEGAMKITTSEGTDYVFLSEKPMDYKDGDIEFQGTAGAVRVYANEVYLVLGEGGGVVSYGGTQLLSAIPVTKIIPMNQLANVSVVTGKAVPTISFVQPKGAKATTVQPGVTKLTFRGGCGWQFDSAVPLDITRDGIHFQGKRGGMQVNEKTGAVMLTMLAGTRIAYHDLLAWGYDNGDYQVTFEKDRITGKTSGGEGFLYLTRPTGLDRLPTLVIDGQTYAPGTSGDFSLGDIAKTGNPYDARNRGGILIVPVLPGEHTFSLRILNQPPIFRNWQAWEQ